MFLKHAEGIGIKHLGPLVAVIACRIAARHDVGELHRHTGIGQLGHHHRLCPGFLLKREDIVRKRLLLGVIGHIEQSETHLSHAGIGHIEVTAPHDAADQFVGQWLPRLIMEGERTQELLLDGEVLHEL